MTLERLKKRFDKLVAACQSEAVCEHKFETATNEQDKALAMINLLGAREERDALLRKWGLYPPTA